MTELIEVGSVEAIFRYPVKSMAGERLESVTLGWHGIEGDRRLAFQRVGERGGMPWLTAGRFPEMILYAPQYENSERNGTPTHVRTPRGECLPIFGEQLAAEVGLRSGHQVQMTQLRNGIFDDATISVIASETIAEVSRLTGLHLEERRFRPNIVVRLPEPTAFQEDEWLGGTLFFGTRNDAPQIAVTMRDLRCSMVNINPDSASIQPEVMKAVFTANQNNAGVYASVVQVGALTVGQKVLLRRHSRRL